MELRNRKLQTVGTLLIGGAVGAGIALLFAPQSGRRTRRDLSHLGQKAINKSAAIGMDVRHSFDHLIDGVSDRFRDGMHWTGKAGREMQSAIGSGKSYLHERISKMRRAS
jgi:gas vesicle protein